LGSSKCYIINGFLDKESHVLPKDWPMNRDYDDFTTEELYDILEREPQNNQLPPGLNDVIPGPGENTEEGQALKQNLEDMLVKAAVNADMANEDYGHLPGNIAAHLDKLRNPKQPWDQILRKYMTSFAKNDYSFRKPNKRFMPYDVYLPTPHSEAVGQVAMAFDMSGSVSDSDITQFVSDVHGVLTKIKPKAIDLVQFDTEIISEDRIETAAELMRIPFNGRGGTDVRPVLQWGAKHRNKDDVMVIFTDGYFRELSEEDDPGIPVVWLIHDNDSWTCPFGKVITYDINAK